MSEALRRTEPGPLGETIRVIDKYNDGIAPQVTVDQDLLTHLAKRDLGFDDKLAGFTTLELTNEEHGVFVSGGSRIASSKARIQIPVAQDLLRITDAYNSVLEEIKSKMGQVIEDSDGITDLRKTQTKTLGLHIATHLAEIPRELTLSIYDRRGRRKDAVSDLSSIVGLYGANLMPTPSQRILATTASIGLFTLRVKRSLLEAQAREILDRKLYLVEFASFRAIIENPDKYKDWSKLCTIS